MPPDFIGIGAQKAGTTWLYKNLQEHGSIWMPPVKELHYFDEKARLGTHSLRRKLFGSTKRDQRWRRQVRREWRTRKRSGGASKRWLLRYFTRKATPKWYRSLFDGHEGLLTGEITPSYTTLNRTDVEFVHEVVPDAKIIFMLRNPVERAFSASVMRTKKMPIDELRRAYRIAFDTEWSELNTDYERALRNWTEWYPSDRIFIGFLEDVGRAPRRLLKRLYRFLDVPFPESLSEAGRVIHKGSQTTMPAWAAIYLARKYRALIDQLADRLGGHAEFWRFAAEELMSLDPDSTEEIPYPFWETPMWDRYLATQDCGELAIQSDLLITVQESHGGASG